MDFVFYVNGFSERNPYFSFCFIYGKLYIEIPLYDSQEDFWSEKSRSYGFSYYHPTQSIIFHLGKKAKLFDLPWSWTWVKSCHKQKDGSWFFRYNKKDHLYDFDKTIPEKSGSCHDFSYKTRYGDSYNVKAYVQETIREYRWKWFTFLSFPRFVINEINVNYVDDKHRISMLGTSYKINKNETAIEALRRIEKTIIDAR